MRYFHRRSQLQTPTAYLQVTTLLTACQWLFPTLSTVFFLTSDAGGSYPLQGDYPQCLQAVRHRLPERIDQRQSVFPEHGVLDLDERDLLFGIRVGRLIEVREQRRELECVVRERSGAEFLAARLTALGSSAIFLIRFSSGSVTRSGTSTCCRRCFGTSVPKPLFAAFARMLHALAWAYWQ